MTEVIPVLYKLPCGTNIMNLSLIGTVDDALIPEDFDDEEWKMIYPIGLRSSHFNH